jgi:hypothetical protein
MDRHGNSTGTDCVTTPEIAQCSSDLPMTCVEVDVDLVTPLVLEDYTTDLHVPCDQTTEICSVLSAHIAHFNSSFNMSAPIEIIADENELVLKDYVDEIRTVLSDPIAEINSSTDLCLTIEINTGNEPCDMATESEEDLATISHDTSVWSIKMDPPVSLSHARHKIAEIPCLNSVYVPNFTFTLVGKYDVDNNFWVHRICITCDDFASSKENKFVNMLDHFDRTSNFGIHSMPNNLPQICFQRDVASNF